MIQQKTLQVKPKEVATPKWYFVDAKDQVVGRLATVLAKVVTGRHKPDYTPHVDTGDFVVVVNADKASLTSGKWDSKLYRTYSGYLAGLKTLTARQVQAKHADRVLKEAVWGMTNKSQMNRRQLLKLKIYAGDEHPHSAQNPQPFPASVVRKTALAAKKK